MGRRGAPPGAPDAARGRGRDVDRVIADAEGNTARFEALLTEYKEAPKVTRDRLYIEAIEEVYSNSNKVFIDAKGSGNLLYLPIDKLIGGSQKNTTQSESSRSADEQLPESIDDTSSDSTPSRDRRIRQ